MSDILEYFPEHPKPKTPFHLVKHRHQVPAKKYEYPVFVQHKFDGVFAALVYLGDDAGPGETAVMLSRSGKRFAAVNSPAEGLSEAQALAMGMDPGVYLCEYVAPEGIHLEAWSGILNPNRKNPLTEEQVVAVADATLHVFDHLTLEEFAEGKSNRTYSARYNAANHGIRRCLHPRVKIVEVTAAMTEGLVAELAESVISKGGEGIVVSRPSGKWFAGKRDDAKTKVVCQVSYDLECLRVEPGKGKRRGMVGYAVVRWRDGRELNVDLGKGFPDSERARLLVDQSDIVGKIVQVDALQESSKGVLRLPKVSAIRHDKTEPDL